MYDVNLLETDDASNVEKYIRDVTVDADGAYGSQCVDLINHLSQKFFGRSLWGNAIDYLNSARSAGYPVYGPDHRPRAGAVFVAQIYAHAYGHVGLVVQDSNGSGRLQTVEQNSGASSSVYTGGPTVRTTMGLSDGIGRVIGYFYFPYTGGVGNSSGSSGSSGSSDTSTETPKAKEPTPDEIWRYNDMAISFLFNIQNDPAWDPGTVFFYNGAINEIQGVHNTEEHKYMDMVYADTHGGRKLKTYSWDATKEPAYVRIFGVLRPGSQIEAVKDELNKIYDKIDKGI
jgi:surface antigen